MKRYVLNERETVCLNGCNHALCYRAAHAGLPLMLFLHGGPGAPDRHTVLSCQAALAEHFTLVCYDQRGAGLSCDPAHTKDAPLTLPLVLEDARQVKEYLLRKFGQEELTVVAHSWGTLLGTLLCSKHPQGIAAYIGSGQVVNMAEGERISYEFVCSEAKKRNDAAALRALDAIGAPENGRYAETKGTWVQRRYLKKYGGTAFRKNMPWDGTLALALRSGAYTLREAAHIYDGNAACVRALLGSMLEQNLMETVLKLEMPVCLLEGRHDKCTPPELAKTWFDALEAPRKHWVWLERSAHSPMREEPEAWREAVLGFLGVS